MNFKMEMLILVSGEAMSVFPNMQHSALSSGFDELCSHMLKGHSIQCYVKPL